jgi:hypothetical protein
MTNQAGIGTAVTGSMCGRGTERFERAEPVGPNRLPCRPSSQHPSRAAIPCVVRIRWTGERKIESVPGNHPGGHQFQ